MADDTMIGPLRKMRVSLAEPVDYGIPVGESVFPMSPRVGETVSLVHTGRILCVECGRETKKSFAQGYCFPCFKSLAECDMCIMKPETCHFHAGTCRDEAWAQKHCMQDHIVYLANSSGLKVGITRHTQLPTRWIDQGASQAIPMFRVRSRFHSGLLEVAIKKQVSDRTDWRKLLKGNPEPVDMVEKRAELIANAEADLAALQSGPLVVEFDILEDEPLEIRYPIERFPEKISSLNFDKTPEVSGVLQGIKGQYLILDSGVINIRKFAGYEVTLD